MKHAILAIEPTAIEKPLFREYARMLRSMQQRGKIGDVSVLSIVHPASFLLPWSVYLSRKYQLKNEVARDIRRSLKGLFSVKSIRAQISSSHDTEDIAGAIDDFSTKNSAELVILIGEKRSKLSKLLFGSVRDDLKKLSTRPLLILDSSPGFA